MRSRRLIIGVGGAILALAGCARTATIPPAEWALAAPGDSVLFAVVLQVLLADTSIAVRVDPRPLRADPRLVTLRDFPIMPDRVDPDVQRDPLAPADSVVLRARVDMLRAAGVARTDAFLDLRCPGILLPEAPVPSPVAPPRSATARLPRNGCPAERYRSVAIALPRPGGVYWPANRDERAKYADRDVYSIRVIETLVTPRGSSGESADYVFERDGRGRVAFLERAPLLIVE